jgi:hypothetical protein
MLLALTQLYGTARDCPKPLTADWVSPHCSIFTSLLEFLTSHLHSIMTNLQQELYRAAEIRMRH